MNKSSYPHVQRAAAILKNGGIIVYPTETVYGIGCDPLMEEAVERIQRLKQRESSKAMLLLADSLEMVESMAGPLDPLARRLGEHFWPGPVTMILKPFKKLPPYLFGSSGGVAFRVTSHRLAASIIHEFGRPIISTSANITGQPPVVSYEQAAEKFFGKVDLIMEPPEPLSGEPSAVIDITSGRIEIIRPGGIDFEELQEVAVHDPAQ
jgi:L-threonylcarbamoyladenylate synthase